MAAILHKTLPSLMLQGSFCKWFWVGFGCLTTFSQGIWSIRVCNKENSIKFFMVWTPFVRVCHGQMATRNSIPRKEIGLSYPGGIFSFPSQNGIHCNGKISCKGGDKHQIHHTSYKIFTEHVVNTFWRQDLSAMPDIVRVALIPLTVGKQPWK